MEQLLVVLSIGLFNGLIIALVAIGYTLVYGIIELINFAHGDVFMIGTMLLYFGFSGLLPALGVPPSLLAAILLLPFIMLFGAGLNASIERVAYRRLRNAPRLAALISAIGMSFVLQNVGLILLGPSAKAVPTVLPTQTIVALPSGRSLIEMNEVIVAAVTIPLLIALAYFVRSTRHGKAMRATAQDREAAGLMGIDVNATIRNTFLIGGALAGAAGVIVALFFGQTLWSFGFSFGLLAFTAAVFGGIGNITGAALGGIALGLVKAFSDFYIDIRWTNVVVFSLLILVLVFRPSGLLGERAAEGS
ncbi:MAG TPA: branched-chain amino acid ABC transporter permease [Vitreimonas sp.]|nr:branched-chain amino acid ABC transporter permease [Vitreimonas sp.]